jgi:hypothetical protein
MQRFIGISGFEDLVQENNHARRWASGMLHVVVANQINGICFFRHQLVKSFQVGLKIGKVYLGTFVRVNQIADMNYLEMKTKLQNLTNRAGGKTSQGEDCLRNSQGRQTFVD